MVWISSDKHVFSHSWEKVVEAALRKYPNPESPNVIGTDIIDRQIDKDGKLYSKRIISSIWSNAYTDFISKLIGLDVTKIVHAVEFSVVDPKQKVYQLTSQNYNFMDYIVVSEKLTYTPDKIDPSSTLLKQEWHVTCKNLSFTSYLENAMGTTMKTAAIRGRQGIEFVIAQVKEEVEKIASLDAVKEMQTIATNTLQEFSNIHQNMEDIGKNWEENLHEELNNFIKKNVQQ
ncbi:PRELI domain containing protein 3B-like [Clavelina lepadiformis]|uniref:PRELI/MSF1 domain-containing protein n=1 Tax=Clavelina lepadiformis TaxID=159417 RepID=A0ABP0FV94_CLALP